MDQAKHILRTTRKFATTFLKEKIPPLLSFHNYNHTLEVVFAARQIADHCGVSTEQSSVIQIAAWFHDCGYSIQYNDHENYSKEIAANFLGEQCCSQNLINKVLACIDATHYPQTPDSPESRILCDADFFHFTRPDYRRYEEALRDELKIFLNKVYSDAEWKDINCKMLCAHHYFTEYGKNVLQKLKEINLKSLICNL